MKSVRGPVWRVVISGLLVLGSSLGVGGAVALAQPASASPVPTGVLFAWGDGSFGALGNGATTNSTTPRQAVSLPDGATPTAIAGGISDGYAIGSDGNLYAWGWDNYGELGNGTTTDTQTTPVEVSLPAGVTPTAIAAGSLTGYAIGSDGNIYAWGFGADGELGNGTTTASQTTPVEVSLPAGVTATAVAAGYDNGYAIGSDGNLYAWGGGSLGELGNGTTTAAQTTPVEVSLPAGVTAIVIAGGGNAAGYAIGSDGHLYAWGRGSAGELGNGTTTAAQATPVEVSLPAGVTATAVAGGNETGYAIGSDGHLYAWGYGGEGALGNGTTTAAQTTPVEVSLRAGVTPTAITAGSITGYAIGSDGNLYAWGGGSLGELGNGTTTAAQTTPVEVSLPTTGVIPTELGPESASTTGYVVMQAAVANTVTVANPGNQTTTAGNSVSLQISATDSGGASLTYSSSGLPAGLSVSPSGLISGSPTSAGTYSVTVTATDSTGASGSAAFTWTVNPKVANTVTVANPGNQTTTAGNSVSLQISATDSGGGSLTYSSSGLPAGLSVSPSGLISGSPTSAGTYSVTVTATDSTGASGSAAFAWTVNPATPQVSFTSPSEAIGRDGKSFHLKVTATSSSGSPVSITSATGLPSWLTFTPSTKAGKAGSLVGVVPTDAVGPFTVMLTASDAAGDNNTQTLIIDVPQITSAPSTDFTVGHAGSFDATVEDVPPGGTVTVSTPPDGLTLSSDGNGGFLISGTPASIKRAKTYTVKVTIVSPPVDGSKTVSKQKLRLTVNLSTP